MSAVMLEKARVDFDLLREAFERAPVGLAVVSADGILREANAALCDMTGYAAGDLEGQDWLQLVHPGDQARDAEYLARVRAGGDSERTVETRLVRRDGSELWVRCSTAAADSGDGRKLVAAFVDLTGQRRIEASLREANEFLSAIVENAPVAIYTTGLDGSINLWNAAAERTFGFTREQAQGGLAPFVPPEKREEARLLRERVLAGEVITGLELERRRADGTTIVINGSAAPLRDETGRVIGLLVACVDVSGIKRIAREHEEHLHFTRALLDAIPSPVYFKDGGGRYRLYNRAWEELFGGGRDWRGKTVHDLFEEPLAAHHHERDRGLLERPSSTTYEALVPTAGGELRQMLHNKVSFVDQKGEVAGLIGVITDVTNYKETERALEASEARFRVLTESSLDLISVVDAAGMILYQSPALRHLLGYEAAETIGRNVIDMVHVDDQEVARAALRRVIESRSLGEAVEFRLRHRSGLWRTFESLGTNCLGNAHIQGLVFNSRDVTDRKVIQQRIQHLAYHDNLTGLPNRGLLQDRLAHSIARAERSNRKVGVLFVDLDNFKNINDTLGHDVGDELLRQVARRLSACVRLEDTIARQGGDEFIVLLDNLQDGRGASVAAQKVLNALRQPFSLGGTEQHVSGSVGIALYPDDGRDPQTLMKNADTAMFHGKGMGKNTYQYFTPQMNVAVKRRMTLESTLRRAVMDKSFVLHYQPQVDLESGEIIALEALVRWRTEGGLVMPGDFIPLAEEAGLISELGEWVLREGCRQAREWQDHGLARRRMAINLSARQFADRGFLDMVTRVLADTGMDPTLLELEITESQVMRKTAGMISLLGELSAMGMQLAIDDFGTGYSSLSYLNRLPIQKLKIDQSFVRNITVDPNDAALVVAIINMARSLGLDTIAEGVESVGQVALLRSNGCRVGQGYHFYAPLEAQKVYPLLKQKAFSKP
jgi:diguanylate cyclase (GGDEF)-like protein/PAS domain S-box-containing protein